MSFSERLALLRQNIKHAAQKAGRDPDSVHLLAVSKGQSQAAVQEALATGQRLFGENRVQEAREKFADLRPLYPDLALHLIGPLQTNKAEEAVRLFDVIHTLDRPSLAESLTKAVRKSGRIPRLFIEINLAHEPQKAGLPPEDLSKFLAFCRTLPDLPTPEGLMCIPPQGENPAPYFTRLRNLATAHQLPELSMGMSADFEEAIRCGATCIRVGTVLFGHRAA